MHCNGTVRHSSHDNGLSDDEAQYYAHMRKIFRNLRNGIVYHYMIQHVP